MIKRKNYSALGLPVGPYVHAVEHNGVLHVSGLTAFGSAAQGRNMSQQAEAILLSLKQIASEEGVTLASLLKVTVFVTHLTELAELRAVLSRHYGDNPPASSLVQVAGLFSPEVNIEIEAQLAVG
ncbi:MAG: RidA family protein [Myxococcota bacterium]